MKKLSVVLAVVLVLSLFTGCQENKDTPDKGNVTNGGDVSGDTSNNENSKEAVEVTILGTIKSEIGEAFEEAVATYNQSQKQFKITIIPMDGQNPFEKMTALYASGHAPTIMVMGQEMAEFKDRLLDLSETEFTKLAFPGTQANATMDGKILGMPFTVEGFGLLYNKKVLNEAVGGTFDPAEIQTRTDLKELLDQIEALDGTKAVHLSPMDWSLGAHVTNILFSTQAKKADFMNGLKAGSINLMDNEIYHGWLDTFDLLMEYNIHEASPLSGDYDGGTIDLANGKVGLWFMGNWAYAPLHELNPESEFGIMPYPISDNPEDYGNTHISVGVPMYMVVDKERSSQQEQEGAVDFLTWLVTSSEGQDYFVNQMNFIPTFNGFETMPKDYMSKEILRYTEEGRTLEWMNMKYPADGWPAMGASMQKYLNGVIDQEALAEEFEAYWEKQ